MGQDVHLAIVVVLAIGVFFALAANTDKVQSLAGTGVKSIGDVTSIYKGFANTRAGA